MKSRVRVQLQLFAQERTEEATPRRRQEARRRGQVAKTAELSSALVLLGAFGVLYLTAGSSVTQVMAFARHILQDRLAASDSLGTGVVPALFLEMILVVVRVVAPVLGAALFVGMFSQVAQIGFMTAIDPLKPQFQRINPLGGLKRIFSKRAAVEMLKASLKIAVVGFVVYATVRREVPSFVGFMEIDVAEAVAITGKLVIRIGVWVGLALLAMAVLDYFYQRWEFEQSIRMSKQEVREELRQTEGDPQIRSRIRQRQRQIAGMRMMAQVPTADVVITNPVHLAVALSYDATEMDAPVVVAKGAGPLAERIKGQAREHGIAVVENVWLARALYESAEIHERIPEELYQAVAEVLAFVYRLKRSGGAG